MFTVGGDLFSQFYLDKSILLGYANHTGLNVHTTCKQRTSCLNTERKGIELQAAAALFVIGSYYLAEYMHRRERRMAVTASHRIHRV